MYCAGVGADAEGRLVTAGGRVLAITGLGPTVADGPERAYAAVRLVSWPGMVVRSDIAADVAGASAP